jgi:hypothetical protein
MNERANYIGLVILIAQGLKERRQPLLVTNSLLCDTKKQKTEMIV